MYVKTNTINNEYVLLLLCVNKCISFKLSYAFHIGIPLVCPHDKMAAVTRKRSIASYLLMWVILLVLLQCIWGGDTMKHFHALEKSIQKHGNKIDLILFCFSVSETNFGCNWICFFIKRTTDHEELVHEDVSSCPLPFK